MARNQKLLNIITLLFILHFASCRRDKALFKISNLNGNKIGSFGHGGMGIAYKYPIDSYESFESCLSIGADGTEMDLQLTKDSVLIAFHAQELYDATLCEGFVNDKLWSEIWGCHFTSPISSKLNLISIDDLFGKLNNYKDKTFTFDCKLFNRSTEPMVFKQQFANAIIRTIIKNNIDIKHLFIESQDTVFLRILKTKNADLKLFIYPFSFEEGFAIAQSMNLYGITISHKYVTKEQVALAHQNGLRVTLWNTHTEQDNIEAVMKNPDFIQTDKINHLLKIFGQYK